MKTKLLLSLLVALTGWILVTAIRIESLNAKAAYYLPRQDRAADDGGWQDGKWRVAGDDSARDQLYHLVVGIGQVQYPLALLAATLGLALTLHQSPVRPCAALCTAVAIVALGLAFNRGYFTSLGT